MKSLINSALLKEQLKRFWAIAALTLLAYVLLILFPIYQMNQNEHYWSARQLVEILAMRNPVTIVASVLVPLVTVLVTFSYLFQSKSATTMHTYPISKNQLLFTNVLAGFILMAVPLLILCAGLLIPVEFIDAKTFNDVNGMYYGPSVTIPIELFPDGIHGGDIINTFPIVAGFFFRTLLAFIFYYAMFLIAAMVTGNGIIYVLVSGVLPFIPSALFLLAQITGYYYCFGFEMSGVSQWLESLFMYTNPVLLGNLFNFGYLVNDPWPAATNLTPYMISYVLITILLFALAFWCSRLRKQERASDSVVFTPIKNVLIFMISILGMIALGGFFLRMFNSILFMYIGFAIGFVITYFVAQMIAERSFNVFLNKAKALIRFGGVAVGLFIIIFVVTKFDIIGYSTYTPKLEDVSGVYLNYLYEYYNNSDSTGLKENSFITDAEIISDTIAVHKKIVGSRDELRDVFLQSMSGQRYGKYKDGRITTHPFLFKLKSGKVVARQYQLPQPFVEESGLEKLLLVDEVILSSYRSFKSPEIIGKVEIDYIEKPEEESNSIYIEQPEQISSILEEIKKDIVIFEHERIRLIKEEESRSHNSDNEGIEMAMEETKVFPRLSGSIELKEGLRVRRYDYFNLESSDNTKAWLIANGYMK